MRSCVVSGSYDPVTNGHMDIIVRAKEIFDTVYAVILDNPEKSYCFTVEQRLNMLRKATEGIAIADYYGGYTVDYCRDKGIKHIVRGLRDIDSYAYELRIDEINRSLNPEISTIYIISDNNLRHISSTKIRQMLRHGEDISEYVPHCIRDMIGEYYG